MERLRVTARAKNENDYQQDKNSERYLMFGSLSVRCGSGGGGGVLEEEEAVNREKEAAWKEIQFHQSDEIH